MRFTFLSTHIIKIRDYLPVAIPFTHQVIHLNQQTGFFVVVTGLLAGYISLVKGSLSQSCAINPAALEHSNYMHVIKSYAQ
jgi:hypothetical protein